MYTIYHNYENQVCTDALKKVSTYIFLNYQLSILCNLVSIFGFSLTHHGDTKK